jgi:hypothetical protein
MRRHLCSPGVFAINAITLLPLLQWRCCRHQAGVVTLVTMALLPLLMHMYLCHCHNGVVALIVLAPLPTLHRHCHPYCASVVFLIALTSLPSNCMGAVTVIGIVAPGVFALLRWCHCPCHAGVVAFCAVTTFLPSSCRPLCPHYACIVQSICRHLCPL